MNDKAAANLAEKIAKMLQAESQNPDVASLFASIEKLTHRLDKLESGFQSRDISQTAAASAMHPSHERFNIAEAIADNLFGRDPKEKACTFEPNGRPCDHCSMCSSRGF